MNQEEGGIALEMMKWKEVAPRFILQVILFELNKILFAVSTNILHLWTNSSDLSGMLVIKFKGELLNLYGGARNFGEIFLHAGNKKFL